MLEGLGYAGSRTCAVAAVALLPLAGAAQPPSSPSPAQPTLTAQIVSAAPGALTPEERIARLEERLQLALRLKDERIDNINERSESVYKVVQFVSFIVAALLAVLSVRDVLLRWREGQRQRGIDEVVKDMMQLQKAAAEQQIKLGSIHLAQAETVPKQQIEAVQQVNDVIEVVRKTLAFRLEQEAKVAKTLQEIEHIKEERDRTYKQKWKHARDILSQFKDMSRMDFVSLTDEQYKRGIKLQGLVDDLNGFLQEQGFEDVGMLLYACGVVAYYDNDVIEAKTYFDHATEARAPEHEGELKTNQTYRRRFAFIHYFRALIHKNWGELPDAQDEIEESARLLRERTSEFLTPVTKAEIQSYALGEEERCRTDLEDLLRRIGVHEADLKAQGRSLDGNQARLRNRMLVLLGNTYFVKHEFQQALDQYKKAIEFNPNDYYALASIAQCCGKLKEATEATKCFRLCLEAVERSGDTRRKRERISRAVIAVIATQAARACGDDARRDQYAREARELLSGNLAVDGMSPKFFSPSTKRLVGAKDLLLEINS